MAVNVSSTEMGILGLAGVAGVVALLWDSSEEDGAPVDEAEMPSTGEAEVPVAPAVPTAPVDYELLGRLAEQHGVKLHNTAGAAPSITMPAPAPRAPVIHKAPKKKKAPAAKKSSAQSTAALEEFRAQVADYRRGHPNATYKEAQAAVSARRKAAV